MTVGKRSPVWDPVSSHSLAVWCEGDASGVCRGFSGGFLAPIGGADLIEQSPRPGLMHPGGL